jgi:hypothetical protein
LNPTERRNGKTIIRTVAVQRNRRPLPEGGRRAA